MGAWMIRGERPPANPAPPVTVNVTIHGAQPAAQTPPVAPANASTRPRDETADLDALYAQLFGQEITHG